LAWQNGHAPNNNERRRDGAAAILYQAAHDPEKWNAVFRKDHAQIDKEIMIQSGS